MKRLRAGINSRLLFSPSLRGFNRYAVNLLTELSNQGVELVLYSDRPLYAGHLERLRPGSYTVHVSNPMPYLFWEQDWLPRQCAAHGVDVLHSPFNFGLPWRSRCPRVLTLHDAIDYVYYRPKMRWSEKLHPDHLKTCIYHWVARTRAHQVITVSEHAKSEIVRYLKVPPGKISVIYEGADPYFNRPASDEMIVQIREKHDLDRPYFFYVGGWEKRKNLPFLLRAFAKAALEDVDLVLSGAKEEQRAEMMKLAAALGIQERVRFLGWVLDEDLLPLYAGSLAFAHPSEHEGFGLQLCEAMAAHCPVLAARATSLPEVLGSGGETFALGDEGEELSGLLQRVARDSAYRLSLVERARMRSGQLSWRRTAEQTAAVYWRAIGRSPAGGDLLPERNAPAAARGLQEAD